MAGRRRRKNQLSERAPSSYGDPETQFEQIIENARLSTARSDVASIRMAGRKIAGRKYLKESRNIKPEQRKQNQYVLTYYMMLGISHNLRKNIRAERRIRNRRDARTTDFLEISKTQFHPKGSQKYETDPHDLDFFKFKDYSPQIFLRLRDYWGIEEMVYLEELCGDRDFIEFTTNSKSGNFFYYSNNGRYMIKTVSDAEAEFLRRLLPDYYAYMVSNPDSLLVRFCGLHAIKAPTIQRKTHFVIMCSIFSESEAQRCHQVFDLKGSTVGRKAKYGESVKKDLDVETERGQGRFDGLRMGKKEQGFLTQLGLDSGFLADHGIMDYSLLLGVHNTKMYGGQRLSLDLRSGKFVTAAQAAAAIKRVQDRFRDPNSVRGRGVSNGGSVNSTKLAHMSFIPPAFWEEEYGRDNVEQKHLKLSTYGVFDVHSKILDKHGKKKTEEKYYMGMIDILQEYTWKKRVETIFKSLRNPSQRSEISCVPPEDYKGRFMEFMVKLTHRTRIERRVHRSPHAY